MPRLTFISLVILASSLPGGALAQLCKEEVGYELAANYVEQCFDISPATHPPCNIENSCELIRHELVRACTLVADDSPDLVPDYCAE